MHNFTLFSREKEWNLKCFHSFWELKSEFCFPFTHFENEKWNENALRSRSRMKSEMKMPRDREVKCQTNSQEFSRKETTGCDMFSESYDQQLSDFDFCVPV